MLFDSDGKTKLDHVSDIVCGLVKHQHLPFCTGLMDSWYATQKLMLLIDLGKFYYCPLKKNRLVDHTFKVEKYKTIQQLVWNQAEIEQGKIIKIKGFPGSKKVNLFRVVVSSDSWRNLSLQTINLKILRLLYKKCASFVGLRSNTFEIQQLTGIEACQCRKGRIQKNHIGCALLVWLRLKHLAYQTRQTIYTLKSGLLCEYLPIATQASHNRYVTCVSPVTMTSHEFRTPLTAILGSTELLRHYSHFWTENKTLLYFNRIQANVQHIIQLLEDVLLLGKAEAGKLKFEPKKLDLVQLCRTLVAELQHLPGNEHTLVFTEQCKFTDVYMDEQLLRHTLGNLLSNAIKYSPIGSTIRFTLACEDETAIFQIQDQGIGIPQEDQQHLFESFYRASNVSNIAGTGLSLAIVKKAVDLHGGEISFDSEVGVGTTFTVTIGRIGNGFATHAHPIIDGGHGWQTFA